MIFGKVKWSVKLSEQKRSDRFKQQLYLLKNIKNWWKSYREPRDRFNDMHYENRKGNCAKCGATALILEKKSGHYIPDGRKLISYEEISYFRYCETCLIECNKIKNR